MASADPNLKLKKRYVILAISLGFATGSFILWRNVVAPAHEAARNLAAINSLAVGETTEAQLLQRPEFQKLERRCDQAICFYHMEAANTLLSSLHLAPRMLVNTVVMVRDGVVMETGVFIMREGLTPFAFRQVEPLPKECRTDPCIQYLRPPNRVLMNIRVLFDRQSDLRNRMPELVNTRCLAQLHGCGSYRELVPIMRELGVEF